ncbi:MAG: DUF2202 domain-containing protein [Armatimonadetes bacterium]|nr:DUF2202 domain-containing protein [Armatimonadota bacterium]
MKSLCLLSVLAISAFASADLRQSLTDAVNDEYHAEAFYAAVMSKFGAVTPFSNIIHAEGMHIKLVKNLLSRYRYPVPPNTFARQRGESVPAFQARLGVPNSLLDSAIIAAQVERAQGPFYDNLIAAGVPQDVSQVFLKLKSDSVNKHLPAFERYIQRH